MRAVVSVGYTQIVLDIEDAVTVARILNAAENYALKWREGGDTATYHIFNRADNKLTVTDLRLISDDHYRIAKLAGRPPE
jgi:hypothetical protein